VNEEGVVPTGLDSLSIAGNPTLKRGANKHCAYARSSSDVHCVVRMTESEI